MAGTVDIHPILPDNSHWKRNLSFPEMSLQTWNRFTANPFNFATAKNLKCRPYAGRGGDSFTLKSDVRWKTPKYEFTPKVWMHAIVAQLFLPTAREGKVFTGVCQSFCSQEGVWCHFLSGLMFLTGGASALGVRMGVGSQGVLVLGEWVSTLTDI